MIHIKETEIIPLLKNAQAEYLQKITEGDPKDAEMAERIEEALTQAMDIVYDYQSMADEHILSQPRSNQAAGNRLEQDGAKLGAPESKRKSQEGGKNQWQKRIKASVCSLKWDAERR